MQACLECIPDHIRRVFVAYSGGLDSSVLLHLLVSAARPFEIVPWHFNHGLVDTADQMQQFCHEQAKSYELNLKIDRLELDAIDSNIEAEARRQRYALFEQQTRGGDCVMTAHHADDQAETFLLAGLRGSGCAGLRGIAAERMLGEALLLRPLLKYSKARLETYAEQNRLDWFEDPSNRDLRFDRNYLRNEVLPVIKRRWPHYHDAFSVSSAIQSESQSLLDDLAAVDFDQLKRALSDGHATLDVLGLTRLTSARAKNLIRYWISMSKLTVLPQARLHELVKQLSASDETSPMIEMPDYSIRRYDRRLFVVRDKAIKPSPGDFDFGLRPIIKIESVNVEMTRVTVFDRLGIEDQGQQLSVSFRITGQPNKQRHRLKRLFQHHRVPPWQRAFTAQVYLDGELVGLLPDLV